MNQQITFVFQSGAYREPKSFYKKANLVLKEGIDFKKRGRDKKKMVTKSKLPEKNYSFNCNFKTKKAFRIFTKKYRDYLF